MRWFLLVTMLMFGQAHAEATRVCVIFDMGSNAIRRVVMPDLDVQFFNACHTQPGERLLLADPEEELTAAVARATGAASPSPKMTLRMLREAMK